MAEATMSSEERMVPWWVVLIEGIAAIIIGRDPERYGFADPDDGNLEPYPSVEAVEVPSPVKDLTPPDGHPSPPGEGEAGDANA